MALLDDLSSGVDGILSASWDIRGGRTVPNTENIALEGGGVCLDATVLYADLAQSSQLATDFQQRTAAKIIKAFLFCCTRLITAHEGKITSFDGDRVMGIFIGELKNTNAATTALKINFAVSNLIKPKLNSYFSSYRESPYNIRHAVGIDTSKVLAVRAGQRGSNDLIWIGRAPNLASKLSTIREDPYSSFITKDVYSIMNESAKYESNKTNNRWEERSFSWLNISWVVYGSSWTWKP